MKYLFFSCIFVLSTDLLSQSEEMDDAYYSDEQRDSAEMDQIERSTSTPENDCHCETRQAQNEAPIYIMLPPPAAPAQAVEPRQIDYSRPQVGPDLYKQFQSGNYQFQDVPAH